MVFFRHQFEVFFFYLVCHRRVKRTKKKVKEKEKEKGKVKDGDENTKTQTEMVEKSSRK